MGGRLWVRDCVVVGKLKGGVAMGAWDISDEVSKIVTSMADATKVSISE